MSAGAIPAIKGIAPDLTRLLLSIKENIDEMRGRLPKQTKIRPLDSNASLTDTIAKVNEIVRLLQE